MILESALLCLAFTIYFEARSDTIISRTAIAEVTMIRANNDQKNICNKVYQRGAFGWVERNNKNNSYYLKKVNSHKGPKNKKSWEESKILAKSIIEGKYKRVLPKKATHFYNPKIDPQPRWATKKRHIANIESHRYYLVE